MSWEATYENVDGIHRGPDLWPWTDHLRHDGSGTGARLLDIAGAWDPTLMFVLGGAVVTNFIGYRLVLRRPHPFFGERFQLPTRQDLDIRLISGASLFGIGWGLSGYCPGPAFASIIGISAPLFAMLVTMVMGWFLARAIPTKTA